MENGQVMPGPRICVDCGGYTVVGWGHRVGDGRSVQLPVSHETSQRLLEADLARVDQFLTSLCLPDLKQEQWDALVSWAYHCDQGRAQTIDNQDYRKSQMVEYLQAGSLQLAGGEFDRWSFARGKFNQALSLRRQKEAQLFIYGVQNT